MNKIKIFESIERDKLEKEINLFAEKHNIIQVQLAVNTNSYGRPCVIAVLYEA